MGFVFLALYLLLGGIFLPQLFGYCASNGNVKANSHFIWGLPRNCTSYMESRAGRNIPPQNCIRPPGDELISEVEYGYLPIHYV